MAGFRLFGNGIFNKVAAQVDKTHSALRVSLRPPDVGVYGTYKVAMTSGVIAAAIVAGAPLFEFRWGFSNVIAIIRSLRIQAVMSVAGTTTPAVDSSFSLYQIRNFTAMGLNNGGTICGFAKFKSQAVSTRMAPSLLSLNPPTAQASQGNGGLVIAATGALTGASGVTDASPISIVLNRVAASAPAETIITPEPAPYMIDPAECAVVAPVELAMNEGLYLVVDAFPATGTWRIAVTIAWDEVDPARYFT